MMKEGNLLTLAEFAWWKIFYFIFRKPIKLTSAVGVRLMGQYKHTNINLTTDFIPKNAR